ncbi:unnamed protein product, partial [Trichogramma brassicae]
ATTAYARPPPSATLGLHIDAKLKFDHHLRTVSAKAAGVIGALAKIMPNSGGPRSSRRKLYAHVVDSILLYGAPVWSTAALKRAFMQQAESAHRRACLRVIGGRPHVAYEATYVLAGIPPLALLADERARLYGRRREDAKDEERLATLSKWQEAWDRSKKARWTHRLIPNIRVSIERRHGELNYHLTQLLTGHGFFKHHSRRYDHNQSAQCPVCPSSIENAEHVFYHCPRFSEERERLHSLLYEVMTPENTTRLMLASKQQDDKVTTIATSRQYSIDLLTGISMVAHAGLVFNEFTSARPCAASRAPVTQKTSARWQDQVYGSGVGRQTRAKRSSCTPLQPNWPYSEATHFTYSHGYHLCACPRCLRMQGTHFRVKPNFHKWSKQKIFVALNKWSHEMGLELVLLVKDQFVRRQPLPGDRRRIGTWWIGVYTMQNLHATLARKCATQFIEYNIKFQVEKCGYRKCNNEELCRVVGGSFCNTFIDAISTSSLRPQGKTSSPELRRDGVRGTGDTEFNYSVYLASRSIADHSEPMRLTPCFNTSRSSAVVLV